MFKTITKKVVEIETPDGVKHETQEAAEIHHLATVLSERSAFKAFAPGVVKEISKDLIDAKATIGPLLRVPIVRARRTPEQRAEIKRQAKEAAAKKKADAKAAKLAAGK